ncbi:MAG TPA: HupE/UreJ family protein [Woeseiaceae bacterium]|nr:HupE/UreJ family protein [Woeseiaceae bacterium]
MLCRRLSLSVFLLVTTTLPAFAHPGHGSETGAIVAGFAHPLLGLDHVLAMLAVGLWAAFLGGRAVWIVPAAFVAVMAGGFASATAGFALPGVEPGVAGSVVLMGVLVAAAVRLPLALASGLVGVLALFHGHAHGTELSEGALAFGIGFASATALLHAVGIGLGLALARRGPMRVRGVGGTTAAIGLVLLGGSL